jgi:hypothetical protein
MSMSESGLRRGQVADAAGVKCRLRYYERRGLLHESEPSVGTACIRPKPSLLLVSAAAAMLGIAAAQRIT